MVTAAPVVKSVTQRVMQTFDYDSVTRRTTVHRYTTRTVSARFTGSTIELRTRSGAWRRVPYVWSSSSQALVYNHYLDLQLRKATPSPAPPTGTASIEYADSSAGRHLLRRATYGPTNASLAELARLGTVAWIDRQLTPSSIDDSACDAILARLHPGSLPIRDVVALIDGGLRSWTLIEEVLAEHAIRAVWSKRQLLAVMEDFWSNNFNVTTPGADVAECRAHYAHTIRNHAFGRYADLLREVTTHPAMLTYLNNRDSTATHPNENHGRELLELHTVGINAGYGEVGVIAAARILTGLSVDPNTGEYQFQSWRHWTGAVSLLGFTHSNATRAGGEAVALSLIDHLAHHPLTAQRVARKLAQHFVSDSPPQALVDRLAATYLANDTRIAPVLRQLLLSAEFTGSRGAKTRRPWEQVVATARVLGLRPEPAPGIDGFLALVWNAGNAGHQPLGHLLPTGYPDVADAWASTDTTLARWNVTMNITANWWPANLPRPTLRRLFFGNTIPATHGEAIDTIARKLFGRTLMPAHRLTVLDFLGAADTAPVTNSSGVLSWNLDSVVGLMLASPYQMVR